jgi:hypothetical protein
MQLRQYESQRGQTLPFWVIGVLIVLSMVFAMANYASAVTWQIRAQNSADAAASGALSVQANMYNEYTTILYATAVDEYRVRTLNQAILNSIYGEGSCTTGSSGTCATNYNSLVNAYNNAVASFTNDIHLLDQANNLSQAGQTTDQSKALSYIQNSNWCTIPHDYACSFGFTVLDASSTAPSNNGNNGGYIAAGDNRVDLVACKKVPYFASGLFGNTLGGVNASYQILGRAAAAVLPVHREQFHPSDTNPQTGQPYQPTESQWAQGDAEPAYEVDFHGLQVNLNWYQAGIIRPYVTTLGTLTCK